MPHILITKDMFKTRQVSPNLFGNFFNKLHLIALSLHFLFIYNSRERLFVVIVVIVVITNFTQLLFSLQVGNFT